MDVRIVLFWLKTSARYVLVACGAFLLAMFIAFLTVLPWAHEDSPGLGLLWMMVFCAEAGLIIPLSLAINAEVIDRKVHSRRFQWSKALFRFLLAVPVCIGPLYAYFWVSIYVENRRPMHWASKEAFFYLLSAIFGYFALRIKEPNGTSRQGHESVIR